MEGTVAATLSYVAQAFRSNNRSDPRLDEDNKMCFLIKEQIRGHRNEDGNKKKQKALPMSVVRKIFELASSDLEQAVSWLLIGALFFAMHASILKTSSSESNKRMKIIRLKNIIFKKDTRIVPHSLSDVLSTADLVLITFKFQKNAKRCQIVHMFNSGDKISNPVHGNSLDKYNFENMQINSRF